MAAEKKVARTLNSEDYNIALMPSEAVQVLKKVWRENDVVISVTSTIDICQLSYLF